MGDIRPFKLRKVARILASVILIAFCLAVLVFLDVLQVGYVAPLVAALLGAALFMLLSPQAPTSKYLRVFTPLFPAYKELINYQEQLARNRSVVERMKYALDFYKIYTIPDKDCEQLVESLPALDTDEARIAHCAMNLADRLKAAQPLVSSRLLQLLYQERQGIPTAALWAKCKAELIPGLAAVLLKSGRLLTHPHSVLFDKIDLEHLLRRFDDFNIDDVDSELNKISLICNRVASFQQFLDKHGVQQQTAQPKVAEMLDLLRKHKTPLAPDILDEATLDILTTVGQESIKRSHPASTEAFLKSICLVSLAMFLSDHGEMRKKVCREASTLDDAVRLTFAYLEFREDLGVENQLGGKDFVSVDYLIRNWAKRVEEKERSLDRGFQKELRAIREFLAEGEWLKRLPPSLEKTYGIILQESRNREQLNEVLKERPWIQESLKRVFRNLTLETVERYLEARTINAYLLTFMSERGTVSGLLDCFILPEKQEALSTLGIELRVNDQPKYNFKQYTNHARIGVVPKGWSFEHFHRVFQNDFFKVVEARRKLIPKPDKSGKKQKDTWSWDVRDLKHIEVIVHRFGLSGRNYYGFVSPMTRPHAIQKIKELFADILNPDDLLSLIEYEEKANVAEAIMDGPITELVGTLVTFTDEELRIFEKQDEALRKGILATLDLKSIKDVGRYLLESSERRRTTAISKAAEALQRLLSGAIADFDQERYKMIAKAYLETLGAVASIGS